MKPLLKIIDGHRDFKYLEPVGEINLSTKNFTYEIHDEAPYKILSTL